jgi:hypothetical protein
VRWPAIKTAAAMQAVGMDGVGWLLGDDHERGLIEVAVAKEAVDLLRGWREELASMTINALGKAMKK